MDLLYIGAWGLDVTAYVAKSRVLHLFPEGPSLDITNCENLQKDCSRLNDWWIENKVNMPQTRKQNAILVLLDPPVLDKSKARTKRTRDDPKEDKPPKKRKKSQKYASSEDNDDNDDVCIPCGYQHTASDVKFNRRNCHQCKQKRQCTHVFEDPQSKLIWFGVSKDGKIRRSYCKSCWPHHFNKWHPIQYDDVDVPDSDSDEPSE